MVTDADRRAFDRVLERLIDGLPDDLLDLLDELPLIVEDEPSADLLREMGMDEDAELCGLHEGTALTDRSVEAPPGVPDRMMLFRGPILRLAGWPENQGTNATESAAAQAELERQVRIALLHEIGHHFGLDEEDLDALGYG